MAIQPVNLGAPVTGVGGDDYRQAHTKINANFVEVGADIVALKAKDVTQDTAINLRATIASVDTKNGTQDNAITAANSLAAAAIPSAEKGAVSGVATLGSDGKVTPTQLPAVVPVVWGSITGTLASQSDLNTALNGKAATSHTHTPAQVGLGNVNNTADSAKPVSTAQQAALNGKADSAHTHTASQVTGLGTAATKDVGTAAGNVMEVGAFGWGSNTAFRLRGAEAQYNVPYEDLAKTRMISYGNSPEAGYGSGLGWADGNKHYTIVSSYISNALYVAYCPDISLPPASRTMLYAEILTKGATGNLPVASIQAGIGAPKLAYKKLTGTTGGSGADAGYAHGLNAAKILSVDVVIFDSEGKYNTSPLGMTTSRSYTYNIDATNVVVRLSSNAGNTIMIGRPITILITYEVD